MKKLSKLFLMGVVALGLGFTACNNDELPSPSNPTEGNSWASITVKFPKGTTLKSSLPGDYNQKGSYQGRDVIESVDVFLVNVTANTVNYNSFIKSAFEGIDTQGVLKPNLALSATAGEAIRVYAVINGNTEIISTLKSTSAANFATAFAAAQTKNASDVATFIGADLKEQIMMTNDKDDYVINVEAGITKDQAIAGGTNHVQVSVDRVVSRAMLTVTPQTNTDAWEVKVEMGTTEVGIAKVTGVTYAVGQSNKNFYLMKKSNYEVPAPVYAYVPGTDWATESTMFDYSGLKSFTAVSEYTYQADLTGLPALLDAETTSKFVLPVNHAVDETSVDAQRPFYKKGNTTYMEIRATFVPYEIDGVAYSGDPKTVFMGANDSKFYTTRELAKEKGQQATEYKDGVMKYVIWLNPNSLEATPTAPNPQVSPTVRNQVYHAHINAFKRMGVPNNPLNPDDPNNSDNPTNPIDPEDPLKTDVTYLSVSVKVLPWTMHSYGIDLGEGMY